MRWPDVWDAMSAAMLARTEITAVMGAAIYLEGGGGGENRAFEVPSLTGMVIVDTESENWEHIDFQIDIYARTLAECVTVERIVRWLFHHDTRTQLGDLRLWIRFVDGRTVVGPGRDKWFGRSLDIRAEPIRSKYVRAAS